MMEKMKKTFGLVTVKAAIIAVVLAFFSTYMPWFTLDNKSQSVMQAMKADPDFFAGVLPVMIIGMLWIIAFFLLNHPKITLIGDAALVVIFMGMVIAGDDRHLEAGMGRYIYLLAVIVCVVCAFLTKKIRAEKKED